VIPYVEDRKNCLLLNPAGTTEPEVMLSLQAALKTAIQIEYQLEDSELAAEALPNRDKPNLILLYEAAEGGAGVLKQLLDDSRAMGRVARKALEICHFNPDTGEDLGRPPGGREDCEAACYDCLMSYSNQLDHKSLDRKRIRDLLLDFAAAEVKTSPTTVPRAQHLAQLKRQCQSNLEKNWLDFIDRLGLRLPSAAQLLVADCGTRPDFTYETELTVVYVDGPHHDYPDRARRDEEQTNCMEDLGYTVLRFKLEEDWEEQIQKYPNIFGRIL